VLFTDLFTVLLSGDETEGQFGFFTSQAPRGQLIPAHTHHHTHEVFYIVEGSVRVYVQDRDGTKMSQLLTTGDFGYVPAGLVHAYQVEEAALMVGGGRSIPQHGIPARFRLVGRPDIAAPKPSR
jgi:quercetin 2,3-dioxygenase